MASTDAIPVPRKNAAYRFYFAIRKPSDSTLITTWTGMDSEVSLDGAAFSDCTNEATEIGTSGCGYIDLTASEMNADSVILKVTVTNTGAVPLVFTFLPESAGDYRVSDAQKVDVETIKTQTVTCAAGVTVLASVGTASTSTAQTGDTYALANGTAGFVAIDAVVDAILLDTGTDGVVVAAGSKTGYTLTATTGLGNQTSNITGTITTATNLTNLPAGVQTSITNIEADTSELQTDWANGGRLDLILDARATQTSVDAIQSDTNDIQTRLPAALEGGRMAAALDSAGRLAIWNTLTTQSFTADSFGELIIISDGTNGREVKVTGSGHIAADVHECQPDGLTDSTEIAAINTAAVTTIPASLLILNDGVGYLTSALLGTISDAGTAGETYVVTFGGATYTLDYTGLDATGNRTGVTRTKT